MVRELQAAIDKYVEREAVVEHDVEQALNEPEVQESLLRELGKLLEGRSLGRDTLADIDVDNLDLDLASNEELDFASVTEGVVGALYGPYYFNLLSARELDDDQVAISFECEVETDARLSILVEAKQSRFLPDGGHERTHYQYDTDLDKTVLFMVSGEGTFNRERKRITEAGYARIHS